MAQQGAKFRLRSEFAMIELEIRESPLRSHDENDQFNVIVRDLENGESIVLDVLELECLTRMKHEDFGPLIVDHYPAPDGLDEWSTPADE